MSTPAFVHTVYMYVVHGQVVKVTGESWYGKQPETVKSLPGLVQLGGGGVGAAGCGLFV